MGAMMLKNTASQRFYVYAWDGAAGEPKTGDAANITAQIVIDGGASAATNDTNPTELSAANHPGVYYFEATQAETNGSQIVVTPVSSTANVTFRPLFIDTMQVNVKQINDVVLTGTGVSGDPMRAV
jgi:hypothetical protein